MDKEMEALYNKEVDDLELLKKYKADNPDCLAFQDTNVKTLSLEERFTEFELEKLINKVNEILDTRKSLYTKAGKHGNIMLPFFAKIKSAQEYRDQRTAYLKKLEVPVQAEQSPNQAAMLMKEVSLAHENKNNLQYILPTLINFYTNRLKVLPHRKYKLLFRWMRYCQNTDLMARCEPIVKARLRYLEQDYEMTYEKLLRLRSYNEAMFTKKSKAELEVMKPRGKGLMKGSHQEVDLQTSTLHREYNLNNPVNTQLEVSDFQVYLRHSIHEIQVKKRLQRLQKKAQWIAYSRRYELYTAGLEADPGYRQEVQGGASNAHTNAKPLPLLAAKDEDITEGLEELIQIFKLGAAEKKDTQEFLYSVNKRFSSVFNSQSQSLLFPPYDINANSDMKEKGDGDDKKEHYTVYLKHIKGKMNPELVPKCSKWQTIQTTRLQYTSNVDQLLKIERNFLMEKDLQEAAKRLKDQAETHLERAEVRKRMTEVNKGSKDGRPEKRSGTKGAQNKTDSAAAGHRRHSLYLLRYLRMREFRKKLLDVLNYFRSIQRRLNIDSFGFALPSEIRRNAKKLPGEGEEGGLSAAPKEDFDKHTGDGYTDTGRDCYTHFLRQYHGTPQEYGGSGSEGWSMDITDSANQIEAEQGVEMMRTHYLENRDDSYVLSSSKDLLVQDSNGIFVMYDKAHEDLATLEDELLSIGSWYVKKYTTSQASENGLDVDRVSVLEELYECETWFQDGKRKVVDALMEAYEHLLDPYQQRETATAILNLLNLRPLLDLDGASFTESYTSEIIGLELKYTLLREVINTQVAEEKRAVQLLGKSLTSKKDYLSRAGYPDIPVQDARLCIPLFPGSSIINVLDFYSSLGDLYCVLPMVDTVVESVCKRFSFQNALAISNVQRAVLQQIMVEWKLLAEEEKIQRQMQLQLSEDYDEHSLLDDCEAIDQFVADLAAENHDSLLRTATVTATSPGSFSTMNSARDLKQGDSSARSNKSSGHDDANLTLGGLDKADPNAPSFQVYMNICEVITMRRSLLESLYETEILYNLHRKQGYQMGVNVKRFHLEPIDFEKRKAYSEIDELLAADDGNEVISIRTEYLSNLAVSEFETSMAQFDFHTYAGVKKVLQSEGHDLRRALTVQLVQRAMLSISAHYNQVPLDYYYESRTHHMASSKKSPLGGTEDHTFLTTGVGQSISGLGLTSELSAQLAKDKQVPYSAWNPPKYKTTLPITRAILQKLFMSVNHIKSIHRKEILSELTEKTSEIVNSKRPELIRKKMRELKYDLIRQYCDDVMLAMYNYALRSQIAVTIESFLQELSQLPAEHQPMGSECIWQIGKPTDQIRHVARHLDRAKRNDDANSGCILSKDGRVEEAWYIPHFLQIYSMSLTSDRDRTIDEIRQHEHTHQPLNSHLKTNLCLGAIQKILSSFLSIFLMVKAEKKMQLESVPALSPHQAMDQIPAEFLQIQTEMDAFMDPSDIKAVVDFLQQKVLMYHRRMLIALSNTQNILKDPEGQKACDEIIKALRDGPRDTNKPLVGPNLLGTQANGMNATYLSKPPGDITNPYMNILRRLNASDFSLDVDRLLDDEGGRVFATRFYQELAEWRPIAGHQCREPYDYLNPFLLQLDDFARTHVFHPEYTKIRSFLEEVQSYDWNQNTVPPMGLLNEALHITISRDQYKVLWYKLLNTVSLQPQISDRAIDPMDELFQKVIVHKAKLVYERDLDTEDSGDDIALLTRKRSRKRYERDLRQKQMLVLFQESNKILMHATIEQLKSIYNMLSQHVVRMMNAGLIHNPLSDDDSSPDKLLMFKTFVTSVLARAVAVRPDATDGFVFQIPESTIRDAMDVLGQQIRDFKDKQLRAIADNSEILLLHYKQQVFSLEQQVRHLQLLRELDNKSMERRVQAKVTDEKYELIFKMDSVTKQNEDLNTTIKHIDTIIRNKVKLEYDDKVNALKNEIMLVQGKFKDYKAKLFREMHINLEDIKRSALLQIGKSDVAPLHMKRQALRMAITEDEINKLKDENTELNLTITKLKMWHEIKMMNLMSTYERKLAQMQQEKEESSSQYWGNQKAIEEKEELMKQQLTQTQNSLSQSEMEVEQLRKDLQLQLKNKKDLVSWKVMHSKMIEDMNRKVKKYEKWSQYDMDKVIMELERRKQDPKSQDASPAPGAGTDGMGTHAPGGGYTGDPSNRKDKEIARLKGQLIKEQKLKVRAFQKLDSLRYNEMEELETKEWQRKYGECASDLQRALKELEICKQHMQANGLPVPDGLSSVPGLVIPGSTPASSGLPHITDSTLARGHPSSAPLGRGRQGPIVQQPHRPSTSQSHFRGTR